MFKNSRRWNDQRARCRQNGTLKLKRKRECRTIKVSKKVRSKCHRLKADHAEFLGWHSVEKLVPVLKTLKKSSISMTKSSTNQSFPIRHQVDQDFVHTNLRMQTAVFSVKGKNFCSSN